MSKVKLKLLVVSAERQLLEKEVDSVTAPSSQGEITVLPGHIPLFTKLNTGELIYRDNGSEESLIVSQGFLDKDQENNITVLVDVAKTTRDISLDKAQEAVEKARATMVQSQDQRELMLAEASLRLAMMEIKVAQKSKKSHI